MSEEKRRTEYRASVESGLKRLETEKLSFLGSSKVISMFDPGTVQEYSQLVGDEAQDSDFSTQEFPSVDDDAPSAQDIIDGNDHFLSHGVDDGFSLDALDDDDDDIRTEIQPSLSLVELNELLESPPDEVEESRESGRLTTLKFVTLRQRDPDELNLDSCETCNVSDNAEKVRTPQKQGKKESPKPAETSNKRDVEGKVHGDSGLNKTDTEWQSVRGFPKSNSGIHSLNNAASSGIRPKISNISEDSRIRRITIHPGIQEGGKSTASDSGIRPKVSDVGEDSRIRKVTIHPGVQEGVKNGASDSGIRPKVSNVGEDSHIRRITIHPGVRDENEESSSLLSNDLQSFLSAERRSIATEYPKLEDFLESCETQDVGSIAEQIRQELAVTNEANIKGYRKGAPQSQIFRTAPGDPKVRQPESNDAMERLKEQGIFEPVPVIHAEVNENLNEIQNLDQVLPPSVMKPCTTSEFATDGMNSEDEDAVHELRQAAELVRAAHKAADDAFDPTILPIANAGDADIENNSTIPIRVPHFANAGSESSTRKLGLTARQAQEADVTVIPEEPENERRAQIIWYAIILALLCGIIYMLYLTGIFAPISPKLDPLAEDNAENIENSENIAGEPIDTPTESVELEDEVTFIDPADVEAATNEASAIVAKAVDFESWLGNKLDEELEHIPTPESRIPYLELLYELSENKIDTVKALVAAWQSAGQLDKAMAFVKSIPVTSENAADLNQMRLDLLKLDPRFLPPVVDLTEEMCDTIDALGGGSTLTFKMKLNGESIAAFKPEQMRRQSNYRSEIAAWRLCELLECDFAIPWNRPIRIEHAVFDKLYSRSKSAKNRQYRKEMKDIIWKKVDGKTYVYGTMKDWVPNFTRFPIEYTSFWKPWLSQSPYIPEYKPLADALAPLKHNKNTQKLHPVILAQSQGLTVKNLAAQVSDVLVFDYLIGNWDRFSGVGSWWGVNCQYKNGHIVSIDNGAAFPKYSNDKVYDRFMMTERFSARFIKNLRDLDKDATFNMLFPEPSKHETACFEQFWKQRESVLSRVDALSEKYGAEKVLSL